MNIKKKLFLILTIACLLINNIFIFAQTLETNSTETATESTENSKAPETTTVSNITPPEITAKAYILVDADTGRVLLGENENEKMYPASLTKLLTGLIATEYFEKDELITVGEEITTVPWDSSISGHKVGETILFENLLRGLLLPSGNDSATVIAMNVARRHSKNENISYDDALVVFTDLMNEKAKEIGAVNSNFITPHGYHDDNHYTTAYDIALITQEALKDDLIAEICTERFFDGNGAGEKRSVDMITEDYEWDNTNLLLGGRFGNSEYMYKYATGAKTGSTSDAGACLSSSATNDDENLIAVVLGCELPYNWKDSKTLLEFGFNNYSKVTIQEKNKEVKEVYIDKPRLADEDVLSLITTNDITVLLNEEEAQRITTSISINEEYKSTKLVNESTTLKAPIVKGTPIGTVTYSLDGVVLQQTPIVASRDVLRRTIGSNFSYYGSVIKSVFSSWLAIPITVFLALVLALSIRAYNIYKIKKTRKRRSHKYRFKSKY